MQPKKMRTMLTVGMWLAALGVPLVAAQAQSIVYVDDDSCPGPGTGTPTDPFCDLQDALTAVSSGDEIWVAAGTYRPSQRTDPNDPRSATFQLLNGVALRGGYCGLPCFGNEWDERDIDQYETILSGDIGTVGDNTDNCYHVVTGSSTNESAVLGGFTVTAGYGDSSTSPNERGAGMFIDAGSPTIANCRFVGNIVDNTHHTYGGGGVCCQNSSCPLITDCVFSENSVTSGDGHAGGGGACFNNSDAQVQFCSFELNLVDGNDTPVGGAVSSYRSSVLLENCEFRNNSAGRTGAGGGGAIYGLQSSTPKLKNCLFVGNSSMSHAGAVYNHDNCNPAIMSCTFSANSSGNLAGGILNNNADPTVRNCIFWGNTDSDGLSAQIDSVNGSDPTITYCCIQDWPTAGVDGNIDDNPLFEENGIDYFYLKQIAAGQAEDSPCVNAGEPGSEMIDGTTRTDGVQDVGRVDMGYHYPGPGCPGDLDGDGFRNLTDFTLFAAAYPSQAGDPDYNPCADLNGDGFVNVTDFTIFANYYLVPCP